MHIPSATTDKVQVLPFEEALADANRQKTEYDVEKWLYVPPFYSEYRYILGTRGKNPLICIGINPSTAQPGDLDNTLKSVERIALGNGFDGQQTRIIWRKTATRNCTDRIWKPFGMCFPFPKTLVFGRLGVRSLKNAPICGNAFWICWRSAIATAQNGIVPTG